MVSRVESLSERITLTLSRLLAVTVLVLGLRATTAFASGCDVTTTTTSTIATTTTTSVPCAQASFPQCGGTCTGGLACGGFESYDPQTMTFTRFCGCVDPASSCGFDTSGTCQPGYCASPLVCGYSPVSPSGPVCRCGGAE
jgi:hypothetical protein